MADDHANPFLKGQLRREAADWWILMHDADAEKHRPEFERWLARGALHVAAYNNLNNAWGDTKGVDWGALPASQPLRGRMRMVIAAVLGALTVLGIICWRLLPAPAPEMVAHGLPPSVARLKASQIAQFVTPLGQVRRVRLADGSTVILDTDTLITVHIDRGQRELRLEHGRARFDVAHEGRPFVVNTGDSEVVAHGTIFDVANWQGDIRVHLVRGSIDVRRPASKDGPRFGAITKLIPGEGMAYPDESASPSMGKPVDEPVSDWPNGKIDFSSSPLAEVVQTANRYSATKIVLAEPALRDLRMSAIYHPGDNRKLADSMVTLFRLTATDTGTQIVIHRQQK
jgi:transmembrane sensor